MEIYDALIKFHDRSVHYPKCILYSRRMQFYAKTAVSPIRRSALRMYWAFANDKQHHSGPPWSHSSAIDVLWKVELANVEP